VTPAEGWRRLIDALDARREPPPLVPQRPWSGAGPAWSDLSALADDRSMPPALRLAAQVLADRPGDALAGPASEIEARLWQAVALRRVEKFGEARRRFREIGCRPFFALLYVEARAVLSAPGPGFRWAVTSTDHLTARGVWDPVWFVDACAAVDSGLLSRETAALLEEIQRAELRLLLAECAAG
jgi:hypothetical protein